MENFLPSAVIAPPSASESAFAPHVLLIKLRGGVGSDAEINVAAVRKQLAWGGFSHIHLELTSNGGDSGEAFAVYQLLRAQPVPISARASIECLSAGMVILMAADLRIAAAGTTFLIHPASFGRQDLPEKLTAASLRAQAESLARTDLRVAQLFADRTGHDLGWFSKEQESEDLLSEVDAIETGLVHEFQGFDGVVQPGWPDIARAMSARGIYLPARLRSENYLAACRCAKSLRREEVAS